MTKERLVEAGWLHVEGRWVHPFIGSAEENWFTFDQACAIQRYADRRVKEKP